MKYLESQEQIAVIQWSLYAQKQYPMLKWLHSSQAGVKMSAIQARIAKQEGMKAGVSDLFLPYPTSNYAGLYIEMKRRSIKGQSKGVLSQHQKDFLKYANRVGYKAVVAYGAEEAIKVIVEYLTA